MSKELGITPRDENYSEWYNDLVKRSGLADNSVVRGCMVIRPHGYAIWELMQRALDDMFKATGHVNAYFPMLIPKSFLSREAEHVDGFAKECAVVTHHRLKDSENGVIVDPDARLEEELIIRPTSETIIWNSYKNWIQSYRDLPLLINQWANVMRWELRPRLFLRTAEFLWQEGHTAHATYEEAEQESLTILDVYRTFAEDWMAVPVIAGIKSDGEKFAGADHTYTIEAMTQDLRAIQAGTSHHLGQNFAKAFDVTFQNKEGKLEYVYATSWGVSTRLIGTLLMVHSDDRGLVLPPKLAPVQVVIIPIGRGEQREAVLQAADQLAGDLKAQGVRVKVDDREKESPGFKFNDWELKGACVRVEMGPRDLEAGHVITARRDQDEKVNVAVGEAAASIVAQLDAMQVALLDKARAMRDANIHRVDTWDEFAAQFSGEGGGGFVLAHWDGTQETEDRISEMTKATIRCIPQVPLDPADETPGTCVLTGAPSARRVIFAKAY
ncbi:MAG TPA: proline--tRNA ligase [Fimbriimonadaceae bacterium]|nr:proline--tRNA ligase [Fimbriimonadaceae bacterium]HRE94679.1 proline--tRNA ligase [Fimbriimonadaceae bacterium]HRI74609.1 proline--tRNA ligase [Fimbriimonadaceae bacterium]